jgi:methionyl-tRNA formyltransferase
MTPPARIVFMGTPEFAVPSLVALCQQTATCRVVGVFSQPDRPAGRGQKLTVSPVKAVAASRGLAVATPSKMRVPETETLLRDWAPDLVVVAAYGRILPPSLLAVPRFGCVNVHASLLPRHRGASPIAHAILLGDRHTGISIMRMDEGCDTGPVYLQADVAIEQTETTGSLTLKLATVGAQLLVEALPQILAGQLQPASQDHARATLAPLLNKSDGALDWRRDAQALERQVRAYDPWPVAFSRLGQMRVQIHRSRVDPGSGAAPGEVLQADANGVVVACGTDRLVALELTPEGRKRMSAAAWVAGRGVQIGDRFWVGGA